MKNSIIILLETATDSCSAALADGEKVLAEKYANVPKAHATLLASFTKEILKENNLTVQDCAAVAGARDLAIFGLRVGASVAKGIATVQIFILIELIRLPSLPNAPLIMNSPTKQCKCVQTETYLIVPMIDAGRMEVYTTSFNSKRGGAF